MPPALLIPRWGKVESHLVHTHAGDERCVDVVDLKVARRLAEQDSDSSRIRRAASFLHRKQHDCDMTSHGNFGKRLGQCPVLVGLRFDFSIFADCTFRMLR
jgi:hypothetical protein